ncbi:NAD-dependent succinate-semialdehyde dehydrogenase [Casimicrobium huifangae]|uniref:NAD-dependent succinate-semialdehyde dehydrogenase n=1 Tax=Casimicrobium huifangae TaxID=2591109 RepID=UPI0012ECAA9C|nr:NAD-dependent succinate-semialdehyde dehydrogenase [Casimicrobium huifangae]
MTYSNVQLLINNEWRAARGGATLPVHNPADGSTIGTVAKANTADLDDALAAAAKGFEVWKNTPAVERAKVMRAAAALLRERTDAIATVMTMEQGKPLAEAKIEIGMSCDIIEWFAEESRRVYGRIVSPRSLAQQQMVLKEPVGPVAAFTPWNFPINQVVRKLSAALATGCSMIVKAAEETPASPAELIRAFVDAGLPAGVVGLVYGDPAEISNYLIPHPVIRKITFTGSTPVGKMLASLAGKHMKRLTMELGGHAPVIVAADANIAHAVKVIAGAKFRNAGQVCISPTRFLVEEAARDEFVAGLVKYSQGLKVGSGLEAGIQMGPLANPRRVSAMQEITEDAIKRGATLATGGERIGTTGNFFKPTVLLDPPLDSSVFNNEPFGPMAAVRSVKNLDEAIAEANRLPFGLSAYAFTSSIKNAHQLSAQVQTGMLWINQPAAPWAELPFGGIKDSGYGSEGGPEALEAYLNTKTVAMTSV